MQRRTCILAAVALVITTSAPAAAQAPTARQPAPGLWSILTRHDAADFSRDEFHGSFELRGTTVSHFHGVTQRRVNSGCAVGETVTVLGSVAIRHEVDPINSFDFWAAVPGGNRAFVPVHITLQRRGTKGHPAKLHHATGDLRIFFPGGTDTIGGFTEYSNITYGPTAGGICNLQFSVRG